MDVRNLEYQQMSLEQQLRQEENNFQLTKFTPSRFYHENQIRILKNRLDYVKRQIAQRKKDKE